ncbi:potassium-transporting ATPase subunit KdpA [Flavihumibacter rivuli]|uniref:potassium-transporting ATPase subunit KdpA n=1 Tax=Flavihumibacter rivuli TaxID=2838156 RepID=UPI001BDF5B38|nr:potassium-transporting ATPase subunit KdpA [Flavihumibacter rivuli]ULQ55099.1 potassium-transporting ATPase subunit KdpA [Flavihumibacter rivuli]
MNTEVLGVISIFLLTILLSIPLGRYIARVFIGERTMLDPVLSAVERLIYRTAGIDPKQGMTWKQHLVAMLTINLVWFLLAMVILMNQQYLPLNPDGNPNMTPDLAFNTAISFLVNCNLQHYSGETGVSYFSQVFALMFLQFVSAGTGVAVAAVVINGLKERTTEQLGNFYRYFLLSCTRILLPLSIIIASMLAFSGSPMTFKGKESLVTLQGDTVEVSRGPVAAFVAIKHLGTNGGGFFGANSAHPLENPSYLTNAIQLIAQVIIPIALVFAMGYWLKKRKLALVILGVMTVGFLALVIPTIVAEAKGNPAIARMGIDCSSGAMEGKETRFGPVVSAYWSIATTVISTGSVNSMHDSSMPLSGMNQMLGMMVNSFYGGCGVGLLNFFVYLIIAVFISGLMVGRTPEFLGKKVEAREMKIAMIIALLHPLLILAGTAIASYCAAHVSDMGWWFADTSGKGQAASNWLNNPGYHGFSEMLYEYTSAAANNGSGLEGLGDNNPFWNISTGIILLLSRFLPIIGPVAIAGLLAKKKYIPESAGTLKADTLTFGLMILCVKLIIAALAFFPSLALGPIAEYFSIQ